MEAALEEDQQGMQSRKRGRPHSRSDIQPALGVRLVKQFYLSADGEARAAKEWFGGSIAEKGPDSLWLVQYDDGDSEHLTVRNATGVVCMS